MPLVFDKPVNTSFNVRLASNKVNNILGVSKGYFNTLWDGGFAGISSTGVVDLKNALNTYASSIEENIALFRADAFLDESIAGSIKEAVYDYVEEVKAILKAFVSQIRVNIADLDTAYEKYISSSDELAKSIYNDTGDIRTVSKSISLE